MRVLILGLALLVLAISGPTTARADDPPAILVIAHPDVSASTLPRNAVRAIFAMRQRSWPGGPAVRVFVLPDSNPVHDRFVKERLDVFPHQLQLSWDRVVFSGTGQAPDQVASQADMLNRVAATPGGIGYVEEGLEDDRVQVIELD